MITFFWRNWNLLKREWRNACLILAMAILWFDFIDDMAGKYAFNMTESVPGKIFKIRPDLPIAKQAIVIFPWDDPVLPLGVEHMTKYVLCLPGDELHRDGLAFYCNGTLITTAKAVTRAGEPLIAFDWNFGLVPDGYFFAGTDHPDGYDSRYYGLVPLASATVVERAL